MRYTYILDDIFVARYNNPNINSDVYKEFRSIEGRCTAKRNKFLEEGLNPSFHLTRRELWILTEMEIEGPEINK